MDYPLHKINESLKIYLLKEIWLRYWIDLRCDILMGLSKNEPLDFGAWYAEIPNRSKQTEVEKEMFGNIIDCADFTYLKAEKTDYEKIILNAEVQYYQFHKQTIFTSIYK
ncbi:hypothetical protein [Mucilaginibacter sp. 10I4]|uniref:hypothetical protein n=1 Tax=Mucilaginibacter sp. 10I4 TaxID=3048580 RepID=UPI002B226794|nr:hypothetical protein [Mucilaginibacter sp. 10I4]MEB0264080.1 hypothetical protein [Mucilaginibacter sp. 10I4]